MEKISKIFVAGHKGLVGSAIKRRLEADGHNNIVVKTFSQLDLRDQRATDDFFKNELPEYVFLAAAKVGGILANNTYRADFICDNLQIELNIINSAYKYRVKKLLFLGSSCIYPKNTPQPMGEDALLTGRLEYTNEPYAIAKIAGIKLCESYNIQYNTNFISAMPTNLYGINDNFDLETSHVLPAMIRKFHEAKINSRQSVTLWGSGSPRREFLYVDDLAAACVFMMNKIDFKDVVKNWKEARNTHLNIGTGEDVTIMELANMVKNTIGYAGNVLWDASKPDGTPRKLLDVSRINSLGWKASTSLEDGIKKVYEWYLHNNRN